MTEEIEKMLFDFVNLHNELRENANSPKVVDAMAAFGGDYIELQNRGIDFYPVLARELADDVQLYTLVLSALFLVAKDVEILDRIGEILYSCKISLDVALGLLEQIGICRFSYGLPVVEYCRGRELHRFLLQRWEKELSISGKPIPYEERDHRLIVVETNTLLDSHAPSQIVLDICKVLKGEMGYEVYLLVNFLKISRASIENYWTLPYEIRYAPELDGEFTIEHQGVEIQGFQQVIRGDCPDSIHHVLEAVREKKPEFVWHIGGESIQSDLLARVTTLVSTSCTDGYNISEAPILASYMQNDKRAVGIMREYMKKHGQRSVDFRVLSKYPDSGKVYGPKEFGIPEDSFAVAIVGNRLDTEINKPFLDIMERVLEQEPRVYFVLIGKCSRDWSSDAFRGRVVSLGYCEDLYNVLRGTKLFLNPVRQGGSGGAACALSAGVPVLTLRDCDVAWAGEDFICGSLEEYPDMVSRYCNDQEFYDRQSRRASELFKSREIDRRAECEKVVRSVKDWQGEL